MSINVNKIRELYQNFCVTSRSPAVDIVLITLPNIVTLFIFSARKIFPGRLGEAERGTWCTARTCTRRSYPVFVGHLTGRNSEPNGGNNFKDHSYQPSVHTRQHNIRHKRWIRFRNPDVMRICLSADDNAWHIKTIYGSMYHED